MTTVPQKGESYPVLNYGHVMYLDHMGTDADIVDAARVSYDGEGTSKDVALLRYLMRNRHTSPFEMCELKLELKMPIFVARQWVRHRTASMNEVSARYTKLPKEVFMPDEFPLQAKDNKQGRQGYNVDPERAVHLDLTMRRAHDEAFKAYDELNSRNVAREVSRAVLPLSTYTKFVWKIDLHNLLHFLKLRLNRHAQAETREFATAINELLWRLWPNTASAFNDYVLDAYTLSRFERDLVTYLFYRGGKMSQELVDDLHKKYVGGGAMTEREWKEFVTTFQLQRIIDREERENKR